MAKHQDPMVGLAMQPWDRFFNEENTRAPCEVDDEGDHCGHCGDEVRHSNMQVLRESKVTCLNCYNKDYAARENEKGDPRNPFLNKKQFNRLSIKEFAEAMLQLGLDD